MRHPLIWVHVRVELKVNTNGFKWPLNRLCRIFVVFMNRRCLFIFMSIGIRRKESEISGICLFLVTHLKSRADASSLRIACVCTRARAQLKTLSSLLKATRETRERRENALFSFPSPRVSRTSWSRFKTLQSALKIICGAGYFTVSCAAGFRHATLLPTQRSVAWPHKERLRRRLVISQPRTILNLIWL